MRSLSVFAALALPLGLPLAAVAQNPFIEAARANAATEPAAPAAVVRAFIDGCLLAEGDATKTVDWVLAEGWEPVDAQSGPGATLLAGRAGTVFGWPGHEVLLAIDSERRCTVLADRAAGPAVRAELTRALGALAAKGARVRAGPERSVERAGAWRLQAQSRWRGAAGTQEFDVGSVTTFTEALTVQVLSAAPAAADAATKPAR